MSETFTCDCLNYCGDDPWLRDGRATPCKARKLLLANKKKQAKVNGIGRDSGDDRVLLVYFNKKLSDETMRKFHDFIRDF